MSNTDAMTTTMNTRAECKINSGRLATNTSIAEKIKNQILQTVRSDGNHVMHAFNSSIA